METLYDTIQAGTSESGLRWGLQKPSRALFVLQTGAPAKPRHGQACNGCGVCCAIEVCRVGIAMYGKVPAPCPGLTFRAGRFWCAVVEMADSLGHGSFLRMALGIERGCDSVDPTPALFQRTRRRFPASLPPRPSAGGNL